MDHSTNACWVLHYGRILNERIGCEMRSHNQSWRVEETLCSRRPPLYLSVSAAEGFLRLALSLGNPAADATGARRWAGSIRSRCLRHNAQCSKKACSGRCACAPRRSGRLQSFPMSLRLEPYLYSGLEWTGFALDQEGCKSVFPRNAFIAAEQRRG